MQSDDVVVREIRNSPSIVFFLGTLASPDQFRCRDRDEAFSWATRFAEREHIDAWLQTLDGDFVLMGSFRQQREPIVLSPRSGTTAARPSAD